MKKILFVVHRYVPFEGGSEFYVRDMAEIMLARGYDVTVLAAENQGDRNGVKLTSNHQTLGDHYDLIVIHGADCSSQDVAHRWSTAIKSPTLHMLIKPSESSVAIHGLKHHRFLGYSTSSDIDFLKKYDNQFQTLRRSRRVRHGIVSERVIRSQKMLSDDNRKVFVSAGGFFPHKAMLPLAKAFEEANIPNAELHLYGYYPGEQPKETEKVKVFFGKSKEDVEQAIANADAYIMNSYEEGFGLVLLEAMLNKVPWFARDIAGAHDLSRYGTIYKDETELMKHLTSFQKNSMITQDAFDYVMANHTIIQTCDDIEDILKETYVNE